MLAHLFARRFGVAQTLAEPFHLHLQLRRLGAEYVLLHRASEVAVEQTLLHLLQFGQTLPGVAILFLTQTVLIIAGVCQIPAEPVAGLVVRDAKLGEVVLNGLLESVLPPADRGMVGGGFEVAAAVIDVLVDRAALHAADDSLAGDPVSAVRAGEHAAGEVMVSVSQAPVLAFEQVLAALEDLQFDDRLVLAGVGLPAKRHHADVEAIVEDVRQGGAMEARVTGLVREALALQRVGDIPERVEARRVQLEDALHRQGVDGVRLDRFVAVVADVLVAERREAWCPSLADLLFDALEYLVAQVVAVVLRYGGHNVERQGSGRPRPELVLDERELDAAGIFEFLHPHRIAHVATDAVELVGQDEADLQLAGIAPDPLEHLVEGHTLRPALRRFGDDEFTQDRPVLLLRLLAGDAELGVDGIALPLFPRRDARPDHAVLH